MPACLDAACGLPYARLFCHVTTVPVAVTDQRQLGSNSMVSTTTVAEYATSVLPISPSRTHNGHDIATTPKQHFPVKLHPLPSFPIPTTATPFPVNRSSATRELICLFDIETTFPDKRKKSHSGEMIEFGCLLVHRSGWYEAAAYSTLIHPVADKVSKRSLECNGITEAMLASAPTFAEVASSIYRVMHGRVWCGHNIASFDIPRIKLAFEAINHPPPDCAGVIDTVRLVRKYFRNRAGNNTMNALTHYFGLGEEKHRAVSDCRHTLEAIKGVALNVFMETALPDLFPPGRKWEGGGEQEEHTDEEEGVQEPTAEEEEDENESVTSPAGGSGTSTPNKPCPPSPASSRSSSTSVPNTPKPTSSATHTSRASISASASPTAVKRSGRKPRKQAAATAAGDDEKQSNPISSNNCGTSISNTAESTTSLSNNRTSGSATPPSANAKSSPRKQKDSAATVEKGVKNQSSTSSTSKRTPNSATSQTSSTSSTSSTPHDKPERQSRNKTAPSPNTELSSPVAELVRDVRRLHLGGETEQKCGPVDAMGDVWKPAAVSGRPSMM